MQCTVEQVVQVPRVEYQEEIGQAQRVEVQEKTVQRAVEQVAQVPWESARR